MKTIYLIMADTSGTTFSQEQPVGIAVTKEKEAKKLIKAGKFGYFQSYMPVKVFSSALQALANEKP